MHFHFHKIYPFLNWIIKNDKLYEKNLVPREQAFYDINEK